VNPSMNRRTLLRATTATVAAATTIPVLGGASEAGPPSPAAASRPAAPTTPIPGNGLFRELDDKIQQGMARYGIPGAAVGVLYRGQEYLRGYGVTNVDYPVPVDADTLFRIGSTVKAFTGTAVMRLVEQGKLDLNAPVRRYLPEFRTSDPTVAPRIVLRQLLNHSSGWLGDDFLDTGPGDDSIARFTAALVKDPQLTPLGQLFAYNNAAFSVAGHVIEAVTGQTYERAVRSLLIDPLGLAHTRYFTDEVIGFNVAAAHDVVDGKAVVIEGGLAFPRGSQPAGGLMSSARDQLRFMQFHLGNGTVPGSSTQLLTHQSLQAMRSNPGPGGTLGHEIDGVGVSWILRRTAQGVHVVEHGGDVTGHHSGLLTVPDQGFAFTLLTNSETGVNLVDDLFADDWALRRFTGLTNLPAEPRVLNPAQLAPYTGRYTQSDILPTGEIETGVLDMVAEDGQLTGSVGAQVQARFVFYRPDFVLLRGPDGEDFHSRADFIRGKNGHVDWLRVGGRLIRHEGAGSAATPSTSTRSAELIRRWRRRLR
jgi:CubicO group peptidase (beta-lactamase class C family)